MPAHVVIAGGGFGGFHTARALERRLPAGAARVTLVSDENFLLYTPFMGAVAGGALEPRQIAIPLREQLPRTAVRIVRVEGAEPERNRLLVRNQEDRLEHLAYDQLVVSLGSVTRTVPVPGLREHAMGFKTLAEAAGLRDRVLRTLEMAETLTDSRQREGYLTFVFVGGGYAGVGGLTEVQQFARDVLPHYPLCRSTGLRWILVESKDRIMGEVPERLGTFAERELRARGIELRHGEVVQEVGTEAVRLASGEVLPTRLVVWTAGVAPSPVVADLGLPLTAQGRILVDAEMRVPGFANVWALGDAAAVPDPGRPGEVCPPTRQHARRQGWQVADNVVAALAGAPAAPFSYRTRGTFVDLGRSRAVALLMGVKLRGFPAWVLTRGWHLRQVPGRGRRFQLLAAWTKDRLAGRETAELGQEPHPIDRPRGPDLGRAVRTPVDTRA